ncbi:hypothetical protein D0Z03_001915 [Geotrichum reessii]|nr:hypothetical protein D0Z03_001915 [Galactomyces reessii]
MPVIRELAYEQSEKIADALADSFCQDPCFHYFSDYPNTTTDIKGVREKARLFFISNVRSALLRGARVFSVVELSEDTPEDPALYNILAIAVWYPPGCAEPTFRTNLTSGELTQKWSVGSLFYERMMNGLVQQSTACKKRIFKKMASEGRLPTGSDPATFRYWYLSFLGVRQANQGQGLGRALLNYSLNIIDGLGFHALLESSTPENAVRVYSKYGFVEEDSFAMDDGKVVLPMMVRPPNTKKYFKN